MLFLGLGQYTFKLVFRTWWDTVPASSFTDLCNFAKVCVFVMDGDSHGYFVNGSLKGVKSEVPMNQLRKYLIQSNQFIPTLNNCYEVFLCQDTVKSYKEKKEVHDKFSQDRLDLMAELNWESKKEEIELENRDHLRKVIDN